MLKSLFLLCLIASLTTQAQKTIGLQQDYYHYAQGANAFVPTIFCRAGGNNYLMARYNYEATGTVAVFWGKTWKQNAVALTPLVGAMAGAATGLTFTLQASLDTKHFFVSTEPQYCRFFKGQPNYLYNWLEAGVNISDKLFAGLTLQSTRVDAQKIWNHEQGLFAGVTIGQVEVPLYVFRNGNKDAYLMMGLHWQWQGHK